eukprot:TRINITY_DN7839_c0_g1_i2.p1 TRINITY_DN7839_c0_g1~~TRINITY_DN7839_c0_g1_i2.p1  ORF type:complete len:686 (+),score=165.46 TRINITY_DN7839_c0_g1_i2:1-2058(+)
MSNSNNKKRRGNRKNKQHKWDQVEVDQSLYGGFLSLEVLDPKDLGDVVYGENLIEQDNQQTDAQTELTVSHQDETPDEPKKNPKKRKRGNRSKKNSQNKNHKNNSNNKPKKKKVKIEVEDQAKDMEVEKNTDGREVNYDDFDFTEWYPFGLHPLLLKGIAKEGFTSPTPIQAKSIPYALRDRKDIVGAAETGSGKTLSFGLPILQRLMECDSVDFEDKTLPCLIFTPTRELAIQIVEHLQAIAYFTDIKIVSIVGGLAVEKQIRVLSKKPDIVVATPGRFWSLKEDQVDYLKDLSSLKYLVIDEADRMVEFGHFQHLKDILASITKSVVIDYVIEDDKIPQLQEKRDRQAFIYSATITLTKENRQFFRKGKKLFKPNSESLDHILAMVDFQNKIEIVDLTHQKKTVLTLKEAKIELLTEEKDFYLYYFLVKYPGRTLVFVNSIAGIRRLLPLLDILKIKAWGIHAQMQQRQRLKNLDRFKNNESSVLIATDVLARGVDIQNIDHVIHYNVPRKPDVYIHRSGRTARAFSTGLSLLFVDPSEKLSYNNIVKSLEKGNQEKTGLVSDFPLQEGYLPKIRERVKYARKMHKIIDQENKKKNDKNWIIKTAMLADIDIDEDMFPSIKKEDDREIKRRKDRERSMKAHMKQLLNEPLLPKGIRRNSHHAAGLVLQPGNALDDLASFLEEE